MSPEFTVEYLDPCTLERHGQNFRLHPDPQKEALASSIAEHGWLSAPIVNKRTGLRILDGHARIDLALERHEATVPCRVIDVPEAQEKRILAVFDQIGELRERDDAALTALLQELSESEAGLPAGWGEDDLAALLAELDPESGLKPGVDPDALPEVVDTRCNAGELWRLGEHRLLCGDSTKPEAVQRLMGRERAPAMLTDPPYQMGKDLEGDDLGDDPYFALLVEAMLQSPLQPAATMVWFHSTRTFPAALDAARRAGWQFERMLWLSKPNDITFPWRGWILTSESILVLSQGGGHWNEEHPFHHDTYEFNHSGGELAEGVGHHPTVKPCAVVADIITRISAPRESVYDAFAGSGTTIVACEQTGRVARCMEIEPRYADVCLARYEQATGREAELLE